MSVEKERIGVYTGSFDPITLGHVNVIERGARLVDRLVVGVGVNVHKKPMFTTEERLQLIRSVTTDVPNMEIQLFDGLAVSFVRACGARVMIRGIRPLTDIAAEFTMVLANRELDHDVETIFLMADQRLVHVSSSLIKQIAPLAGDEELARFVPREVVRAMRKKQREGKKGGESTL
jgi:pantetheine-phosphate adenylyltransferase